MNITKTRKRARPNIEDRRPVADQIVRITGGYRPGGLQVDWKRLDDEEAADLVALVRKCDTDSGFILSTLSAKESRRLEELIEQGSDAGGVFAKTREAEKLQCDIAAMARKARRLSLKPEQERGFLREMYNAVSAGELWAQHVGFLTLIVSQFVGGEVFNPRAHFEGSGDTLTLVVDVNFGWFGPADPEGVLAASTWITDHLVTNRWLVIERAGPECRVRLGPRTREVLGNDGKKTT